MQYPCSHNQNRFTITGDKPLPFTNGVIYWYVHNKSHSLHYDEQEIFFEHAFDEWAPHFAPLRFTRTHTKEQAYIHIYFSGIKKTMWAEWLTGLFPRLKRFFSIEPFPMGEGTLAYAFGAFSHPRYSGHLYINDSYDWRRGNFELSKVVTHELGHTANIGHTDHDNDIMFERYNDEANITQDSINAVNKLYQQLKNQTNQFS